MAIDSEGICGGCRVADDRRGQIDYRPRVAQLSELLGSRRGDRPYDCIVAWSGGKDSSAIALQLKYDFGLNPLLVTFSPLLPTPEGDANRTRLLDLGFDSVMVRPNQNISRILARRFFVERGDPKVHWNAGINAAPMRMAVALKIPLVFYAEHGESEYGGRLLSQKHLMERDLEEVLEHQVGDDPLNWATGQVGVRDLYPYLYPDGNDIEEVGLRALYFAYFTPWDVTENYKYVSEYFPFQGNARGRTYGTFTDYDSVDDYMDDLYYYMQFVKFGFGRCLRDCARMIQRGRMTREEAFSFISRYDGEFPEESIGICLDYIRMERAEFNNVVDRHRSPRVWERDGSSWKLRFPPHLDE